jgi:putative phosphoribosyl transferase
MIAPFRDRTDAGQQLVACLGAFAYRPDVLVLGLPRGGVPVAFVVASTLHVPMDLLLVRKLGVPGREELAFGAIASGKGYADGSADGSATGSADGHADGSDVVLVQLLNHEILRAHRLSDAVVRHVVRQEEAELARRERAYRGDRPFPSLAGRAVLLVDDGLATGATMRAALAAVRREQPARVVIATPVGDHAACMALRGAVDAVVCVREPEPLRAVAAWYQEFPPTSDEEVQAVLERMRARAWRFAQAPQWDGSRARGR